MALREDLIACFTHSLDECLHQVGEHENWTPADFTAEITIRCTSPNGIQNVKSVPKLDLTQDLKSQIGQKAVVSISDFRS